MKKLLFATSIVALSTAAHAAITCNLTDQQGHALQYSFTHGGHGYTNEIVVKRDGAVVSNGGPMWTRTFDSRARTMTLEQAGWSIVYEAKPNDSDTSQAALFHASNRVATGVCNADHVIDNGAPTIEASTPETPDPATPDPTPAVTADDSVPIVVTNGAAHVKVYLGGYWANMLIDTGANGMSISPSLAQALVSKGDAYYANRTIQVTLADGSAQEEQIIVVHKLTIGNHTLTDVPSTVTEQETEMLLPFPVLSQIGKFTIDTKAGQLIFGT
jgi:hypothetical protein